MPELLFDNVTVLMFVLPMTVSSKACENEVDEIVPCGRGDAVPSSVILSGLPVTISRG